MEQALIFFDRGGGLLWVILLASVLMWTLILERYWFLHFQLPRLAAQLTAAWRKRRTTEIFGERRLKEHLVARFFNDARHHLKIIDILTQILPLLGLLGTVLGMIKVFEVINVFGAGNARGMAEGISEALITTMAGLVTALSGLFFSANLQARVLRARDLFATRLTER